MPTPPPTAQHGRLTDTELPLVHFILNTDCNAWELKATAASPGVCKFCYRERNRVQASPSTVTAVLDVLRAESEASWIVFTGGDPVMPYDNHLELAAEHAVGLGFNVNVHTNGLLLGERYEGLRRWVRRFSLAIDGPDAATADWFRGDGYFDRFTANVDMLVGDKKALAFNTFTSPTSISKLPETAQLISSIASQTSVDYWLISQYRPIGRADTRKAEVYGFSSEDFSAAVEEIRPIARGIKVFDQPTRSNDDPYPFRVWVLADGTVTVDLGSVAAPRNDVLGNVLRDGFAPLVRRALSLRGNASLGLQPQEAFAS